MRITIVGAGLGGLTAAWELVKSGHDVAVLEARDRVGGRTWSARLPDGTVTERGGEYVFPREFAARRLAAELELPIVSHGVPYARRSLRGIRPSAAAVEATMAAAAGTLARMRADGLERISVAEVFRTAVGERFEADPAYRRLVISLAADPAQASAVAVLRGQPALTSEHLEDGGRIWGGNQRIALELARRLGERVRLESPVAAVERDASSATVTLVDGSLERADAVVVAVPLPILRTLHLGFELPATQREALDHRFMGVAAKLGVPVASTGDDPAVQSPDGFWWSWRSMGADGEHRVPALSHFASTTPTLAALGADATGRAETWAAAALALRPGTVASGEPLLTTWADDPWTRGAYSAPTLDWREEDELAFERAAGRVAFAGEHTASAQTISGAVASGYRAARAIEVELARA
ncbi:flavin monoamine oxidase family protein [Agromyces soli]